MSTVKKYVRVRTRFAGFHRWASAPDEVGYLRDFHRHEFRVEVMVPVSHGDRAVEFFSLKAWLELYLETHFAGWANRFEMSCEDVAEAIMGAVARGGFPRPTVVTVSEDGENDGIAILSTSAATVEKVFSATVQVTQGSDGAGRVEVPQETAPVSKQTRCRIFVGTEAEGPHRGKFTLFVPATCTRSQVLEAIEKADRLHKEGKLPKVEMLYFGAGNLPVTDSHELAAIRDLPVHPVRITVEVEKVTTPILEGLTGMERCVVSHDRTDTFPADRRLHAPADFWKEITDTMVIWRGRGRTAGYEQTYQTALDDPLFDGDRFLSDF